jgi:hypothetical protein
MAEPETDELRVEQIRRERAEHARARDSVDPAEERQHERRADKAAYLKDKLDQRAESEERVQGEP